MDWSGSSGADGRGSLVEGGREAEKASFVQRWGGVGENRGDLRQAISPVFVTIGRSGPENAPDGAVVDALGDTGHRVGRLADLLDVALRTGRRGIVGSSGSGIGALSAACCWSAGGSTRR